MSEARYFKANGAQAKLLPPDGGQRFQPSPGEDVFFKMGGDETEGLFDYFEIRVSYLEGPPLHIHSIQHETFHVLEGELSVKIGDELVTAQAGDFLFIPKGTVHTYVNLKHERARAVGNLSPGGFDKFVAELNAYQRSASPPDPKIIAEISAKHHQVFSGPPLAISMGLREALNRPEQFLVNHLGVFKVLQVKVIKPGEGKLVWAAGDHYTFKVIGQDTGGTYSLFEGLVPPQAGPPPHFHQREFEAFYILEGELTFHSQAGSVAAGPGTYVHIPKNLLHTFKNESNRPVRMLAIVAPAGMENFLEEIGYTVYDRTAPPAPLTPAAIEKILEVAPKYGIGIVLPDHATVTPPSNTLQVKVIKPGEGKLVWAAGDHYTFKVIGQDTGGTYSLFEGLVPPQAGPPPHFHQREFEAFYILEGELTFHSQAGSVAAGPGTYVHIPKNLLHTFKNESNRPVRMLAIVAPAGMENFLEEIGYTVYDRTAPPAPLTPAAIEKILEVAPKYGIGIVLDNAFAPETKVTAGNDYAQRDAEARVSFYVLLWKRRGISLQAFDDYWRDVHGPVCARLPGQFQYWQFHVGHNEGGLFPSPEGVHYTTEPDDQIDGIAELTFRSVEDRQSWFDAASILMDDEHNIFSKAIGYVTDEGNSKSYVDKIDVGDPNGNLDIIKFHVMVRQSPAVATTEFRRYMINTFAANVVEHDRVLKFRLHLFEPPDLSRADAAGVVHFEPPEKQYQAAFEIAFRNNLDMESFFASAQYSRASANQSRYIKQFCPFPERNVYTFVYGGFMPLAGQRGSRTAELITSLGATNQLRADIHDLVVGQVQHSRPLTKNGMERSAIPSRNGEPAMANNQRPVQTKKRVNFYEELSADYSRPEPVARQLGDRLIVDAERYIRMKERTLPDISARYSLEVIEQENKDWWPTHCEALRRGRGDLLTAEYHENLVYFCQDGPYYGLSEQKEREQHWWALIAQPGVTMTWPVVMFHGEFVWFEWACIDDETRETIAKGSVAWVRRGHRGGCFFKGEQLTFYRDVFASPELLKLITT